jgi:Flp pilus assembly protein TadD
MQLGVAIALGASAASCFGAAPVPKDCLTLRLHGKAADAANCFELLTRSNDAYFRAEGFWGLEQYDAANEQFRDATTGPGAKPLYKVRWGRLLHERNNDQAATDLFHEALAADPANAEAYVGLALVSATTFDGKATEYARKALELDPKSVGAHELMAGLELEDADPGKAAEEADRALALSPDALKAYAIHAAIELIADRPADAWLAKMNAVNPNFGAGYEAIAYYLTLNRRYTDGVAYYRKAIAVEPRLWTAHEQLGINLMRLGQTDEPVKELQLAYDNGQRDAETVNSLRLLDSYKNFVTFTDDTTILRLRKNEAELLRPYFEEQLHKAIATYTKKYGVTLPGPVQVEVYPDHEDFAVRTMGMPGLGALGVTFGEVVAMDSPSGRKPGDFNWGATLWHEMSHVFILTATNNRVPRWFTEGLAVHEEGQANPLWANRLTPDVVAAIRDKKLLPVTKIDQGFIFPEYPSQVIVSYYQAGTICDYIAEHWGNDALMGMVHSFAALKTTPEAIQANLHVAPEEFDKQYAVWLDKRVGPTVANFDAWRAKLKALVEMSEKHDDNGVIAAATAVIKMYPEYVEDANAYEIVSNAQLMEGNKQQAADALKLYELVGGENPKTLEKLASLEKDLGREKDAADTLSQLNFIYPEDQYLHETLGALLLAQGISAGAVREYQAVLAMKPLDMASAQFHVAKAYLAAGDKAKAEENVLGALEVAPNYRPAQELLLELESNKPARTPPNSTKE